MKGAKIILFSVLLIISICLLAPNQSIFAAATPPTLAINTSATGYTSWGSSVQVTLTTTAPNTLLYLSVAERASGSAAPSITGVSSTPTLTWTKRGAGDAYWYAAHQENWFALWPSSGTITITVSMSSSTCATVVAFAVTGADLTSPFDGDARIVTSSTAGQMWPSANIYISTNNPNDLIIGTIGLTGYSDLPALTPGSGFSLIQTRASSGNTIESSAQDKVVSTTQSNLQITYYYSSTGYGSMIADAVKAVVIKSTELTVACTPETVDKNGNMQTQIRGTLTSGTTLLGGKDIVLTYNNGQTITTVQTQTDGSYFYPWTVPSLVNGFYAAKADFVGDNQPYASSSAETTSSPGGGGIFVVPEYALGGLAAIGACFLGYVVYRNHRVFSSKLNKT
jgi:hypothetical protein